MLEIVHKESLPGERGLCIMLYKTVELGETILKHTWGMTFSMYGTVVIVQQKSKHDGPGRREASQPIE